LIDSVTCHFDQSRRVSELPIYRPASSSVGNMNGQSGPPPGITDMSPDMRLQAMQAAALSHGFYNFNMPVTSPTMLPSPSSSVGSPSGK